MKNFFYVTLMTVKPDSKLYKDYYLWLESYEKLHSIVLEFLAEFGIETTQVYIQKQLTILPTENDKVKFAEEMLEDGKTFKEDSKINKAWEERTESLWNKPNPILYTQVDLAGAYSYRLFNDKDILYCGFYAQHHAIPILEFGDAVESMEYCTVLDDLAMDFKAKEIILER